MNKTFLTYKKKDYVYGFERVRDYPFRGKTSLVFYIKVKVGIKPFEMYRIAFRSDSSTYRVSALTNKKGFEKIVLKEIDKYILKSRRRKLIKLRRKEL